MKSGGARKSACVRRNSQRRSAHREPPRAASGGPVVLAQSASVFGVMSGWQMVLRDELRVLNLCTASGWTGGLHCFYGWLL